jgi:hypothetical protein
MSTRSRAPRRRVGGKVAANQARATSGVRRKRRVAHLPRFKAAKTPATAAKPRSRLANIAAHPMDAVLSYYASPGKLTDAKHPDHVARLPHDIGKLVRIVQGLAIHEHGAGFYGEKIPEDRKSESHLRAADQMLDRLLQIDDAPLAAKRPLEKRLVGVCDHFARLLVAFLRSQGTPARCRFGFGAYFNPPNFEEHIVVEYWDPAKNRWKLADPQFDDVWREKLKIGHDILDVPRTRFLTAADAWRACREKKADPAKFGIFVGEQRGYWYIAGELIRDLASLNKVEVLPWDVWGAMPKPKARLTKEQFAYFDELAALVESLDGSFGKVRARFNGDDQLRVPGKVFNALLQRMEHVYPRVTADWSRATRWN